jgi:hypothetical protein
MLAQDFAKSEVDGGWVSRKLVRNPAYQCHFTVRVS